MTLFGTRILFALNLFYVSNGLFKIFGGTSVKQLKVSLLEKVRNVNKGLLETKEDRIDILNLVDKLERLNSVKEPLKDPRLNAEWTLEYTTSDSVLGRGGYKRVGPTLQIIDTTKLTAENKETISFYGVNVQQRVTAKLTPLSKSQVAVQFDTFYVGPIPIKAPPSAKGTLDVTYLDSDLRISRGDKGNLFVLSK